DRTLEGDDVPVAVVEDARLRMVKGTKSAWVVGSAGMIERESNPDFEQARRYHPREGAETIPGDLVFFWPPARRHTHAIAIFLGRFEVFDQRPVQTALKCLDSFQVRRPVVFAPRGAGDKAHRGTGVWPGFRLETPDE